jgi:hypothetical protein
VRGAAPYIHEAVHHLVFRLAPQQTTTEPHFWVFEGFPGYVEDAVVARYGGTAGRVFVKGGNETVDDEARSVLATPKGGKCSRSLDDLVFRPVWRTDRRSQSPFTCWANP